MLKLPLFSSLRRQIKRFLPGSDKDPFFSWLGLAGAFSLFLVLILVPVARADGFLSVLNQRSTAAGLNRAALKALASDSGTPDFAVVQKNSFKEVAGALVFNPQILGSLDGTSDAGTGPGPRQEVVEYEVRPGDTLSGLADSFGLSLATLLNANNLTKNSRLTPGKRLIILPVSGVLHVVKAGDTLGEIVRRYKGDLPETINFNGLQDENDLAIGDIIIVPNGVLPPPSAPVVRETLAPLAAGYFICPISDPCRRTQGLHWYNAVDLSHGECGEPILASAAGVVQKVKLTSSTSRSAFGGAGNHLTILHPNGVVTFYGHLLSSLVSVGQAVVQGQVIGYMGGERGLAGAGRSTGCHVHFEVVGAQNPFAR